MKILYIAEDYHNSKVHHLLCRSIAMYGHEVTIYALRRKNRKYKDLQSLYGNINYQLISPLLSGSHFLYKYFFPYKEKIKYRILSQQTDLSGYDFVHAATLFSEGAIALEIYKQFHIPYIVTVRGTDVNLYLKKMPFLWKTAKSILQHATKVIFISPKQQSGLYRCRAFADLLPELKQKSEVIPNGLENFWHENSVVAAQKRDNHALLYIGKFDKNKNVKSLIQACEAVRKDYPDLTLTLVGGNGDSHQKIVTFADHFSWVNYLGSVYEQKKLMNIFRAHSLFAMVSHSETFGLVYLEALSQGLPVIYTKGEGFDGIMENEKIGFAADADSVSDIARGITAAFQNYDTLCNHINNLSIDNFRWDIIAKKYNTIYDAR